MEKSYRFTPRSLKKAARSFMIGGGAFLLVMWLALFGFTVNNASAATLTIDGYTIVTSGTTCTISGYSGSGGDILIPGTLSDETNSYAVTAIGSKAFYNNSSLTSVNIPNSVTSIEDQAFSCCYNLTRVTFEESSTIISIGDFAFYVSGLLTEITIPASVTKIGNYAFAQSGLTSVTIPANVTSIGEYAFSLCSNLASITLENGIQSIGTGAFGCSGLSGVDIPESVTSIGSLAFDSCSSLTSINVDSENSNYASEEGVLFNKAKTELIKCPENKTGSYTIPATVTTIDNNAFFSCGDLTSITIPGLVTTIGEGTFSECKKLSSVTFNTISGTELTTIGINAFSGCTALTDITIPGLVTTIGENTFAECSNLSSVTFDTVSGTGGTSVTTIGSYAFGGCTALNGITIPDSVSSIESYAFYGCTALTGVKIPASVTSLGDSAFADNSSLRAAYFYGDIPTTLGYEIFTNAASGFAVYIPVGNTTYDSWAAECAYTLKEYSVYKGAQKKSDGTIRLIAIIDSLEPTAVGFVYSTTNSMPTITDGTQLSTTKVYTSIIAKGSTKTAADLDGTYIVAIPVSGITNPIYVRTFVTKDGTTEYSAVLTVTPADLPLP